MFKYLSLVIAACVGVYLSMAYPNLLNLTSYISADVDHINKESVFTPKAGEEITLKKAGYGVQNNYRLHMPLNIPSQLTDKFKDLKLELTRIEENGIAEDVYLNIHVNHSEYFDLSDIKLLLKARHWPFPLKLKEGSLGSRNSEAPPFIHYTAINYAPASLREMLRILSADRFYLEVKDSDDKAILYIFTKEERDHMKAFLLQKLPPIAYENIEKEKRKEYNQ